MVNLRNELYVYVAGPYTNGSEATNVRRAIEAANRLRYHGATPFVPHLTHFWHLMYPDTYSAWMEYDLKWLQQCDVVLRIPGPSPGGDDEVRAAKEAGIPVYFNTMRLVAEIENLIKEKQLKGDCNAMA